MECVCVACVSVSDCVMVCVCVCVWAWVCWWVCQGCTCGSVRLCVSVYDGYFEGKFMWARECAIACCECFLCVSEFVFEWVNVCVSQMERERARKCDYCENYQRNERWRRAKEVVRRKIFGTCFVEKKNFWWKANQHQHQHQHQHQQHHQHHQHHQHYQHQ